MNTNIIDIFQLAFLQRALIAGLLVGYLGSFYGTFVVQRKMSFMGDGLAHAAFGGVALGLLLQTEPLWIAIPVTVLVAIGITYLKDKTELEMDTSIGIFFAVSMALGIIFISLKKDYSVDAFTYLFGSILSVQTNDLIIAGIFSVITFILSFKMWKRWAYATFDSELARTDQLPVKFDDYLLSVFISLTVVLSIKLVGIVLIAAYLVIPAATSRLISKTFFSMTVTAIFIGSISAIIGLILSLILDLPSGAVIILTQASLFIIALLISKLKK